MKILPKQPKKIREDWNTEGLLSLIWESDIVSTLCVVTIGCILIMGILFLCILDMETTDHDQVNEENAKMEIVAEEFNSMSESSREELAPLITGSFLVSKDNKISVPNRDGRSESSETVMTFRCVTVITMVFFVLFSLAVTLKWRKIVGDEYYLADLPYWSAVGKILLIMMWVAWPFLWISYKKMETQRQC